jgi:tRNA threonylcarbamoyladenosine modification (KEOPS) complex Cgi121 subunit
LILDFPEYGKFVLISAFKVPLGMVPSIALKEVRETIPDIEIQFLDGENIAGKEHLEIAAINALHAFKTGINISRSLPMETLLYASAQRQIAAAILKIGVTDNSRMIGFVSFSGSENDATRQENEIAQFVGSELDESLLDEWSEEKKERIMALYEIGITELEAISTPPQARGKSTITRAVIERVAILATKT